MLVLNKKRLLDLMISVFLIIITLPVQIYICFIILIVLRENPIFFQERGITLNSFRFRIIKFRTIQSSQQKRLSLIRTNKRFLLSSLDFRFDKIMGWLRKTGLDEIPQLYNILFGDMSLVGPRPLMLDELQIMKKEYPGYNEIRDSLGCKPGLTGIWQIFGDRNLGIKNLIELDSFYEINRSIKMDIAVLIITFIVVTLKTKSNKFFFQHLLLNRFFNESPATVTSQSLIKI